MSGQHPAAPQSPMPPAAPPAGAPPPGPDGDGRQGLWADAEAQRQAQALAAPPGVLQAIHVARWYGNVVAVNDITFGLGPGITGLLGPNGAGKSTLLHMLAGLLRPSSGEVRVEGQATWARPSVYRRVGLVPERDAAYNFLTAREFALMNARLQALPDPDAAASRAIEIVGLGDAQHRAIGGYSKGMRQRAKLAGALVHDPPILLLDEPFNGMDPRQRLQMMDLLTDMAAQGRAILFSSHILEEVERLAQNVLVIVAGRLAASGDFREIRRLMTDRPHEFSIRSSDDRMLASALLREQSVKGVQIESSGLDIHAADFGAFTRVVARVARDASVTIFELRPTDESLESVFSYLVNR